MNIKQTILLCTFLTCTTSNIIFNTTTVVTISGQKVIQNSETGKKIQQKLQKEQESLAKPLQAEETIVRKKEKDLQEKKRKLDKEAEEIANSKLLSQEAKQRKYEELQDQVRSLEEDKSELERLVRRLQDNAKRVENKMSQTYQEEMTAFDKKIKQLIKDVAEKHGWDIVLMEEAVVYASKNVSKTDIIIKELDNSENLVNATAKRKHDEIIEKDIAQDLKKLTIEL